MILQHLKLIKPKNVFTNLTTNCKIEHDTTKT